MSKSNNETSPLKRLVDLLESRVGDPVSGYYGTVKVDDAMTQLVGVARSELEALLRFKARLEWLHTGSGIKDGEGYEWGVARVKFNEHGQFTDVLWTNSDHSDLDAEMMKPEPHLMPSTIKSE